MNLRWINRWWFAVPAPAAAGFLAVVGCVHGAGRYGWSLFIVLPVAVSFLAAFCRGYGVMRTPGESTAAGFLSLAILGFLILGLALDGLICLVMAAPLVIGLGLIGAQLGRSVARLATKRMGLWPPLLVLGLFPFLVAFEDAGPADAPLRAVTTSVPIRASAERVWEVVVAFPRIQTAPDGIFRCGIACPVEARIEGTGVGAVRYCTFTTGDFVEPITAWRPGELLAFDVTSSPVPMEEFSWYERVEPPHLDGHMRSHRGQFRLRRDGDVVVLEGTTWYEHRMWPQWYWGPMTDYIIHRIHDRVLEHIRGVAESGG